VCGGRQLQRSIGNTRIGAFLRAHGFHGIGEISRGIMLEEIIKKNEIIHTNAYVLHLNIYLAGERF